MFFGWFLPDFWWFPGVSMLVGTGARPGGRCGDSLVVPTCAGSAKKGLSLKKLENWKSMKHIEKHVF